MAAVGAAVATHDDLQGRGSPPERFVRKPPDHRVPRNPFAAAATAPLVEFDDAASDHRAVGLEPLPNGFETELIQSAERGQVRASEGSVVHVEVFRMGSVKTSILGRPRLLSRHRRAVSFYTLICEEPVCLDRRAGTLTVRRTERRTQKEVVGMPTLSLLDDACGRWES